MSPCTVTVCRGSFCGKPDRIADIPGVRTSSCLDACSQATVVVVQPSAAGRAAGGRPVWLGLVNDEFVADDIAAWVRAGGPGVAEPPAVLDLYVVTRPAA
ncbi:hypothetical protein [Winogradskya humida]|uniref:Uncharacterized protein n=1 Tax=Winogradskya humida TaxID=113566 RepID=A0ABQ4A3R0_9ACTN|nr:hypothetical protein [Actinoplanes humidus]GIE25486.1 hypothetical protein Ahu01nite_085880 [Actinoplanes humidus]